MPQRFSSKVRCLNYNRIVQTYFLCLFKYKCFDRLAFISADAENDYQNICNLEFWLSASSLYLSLYYYKLSINCTYSFLALCASSSKIVRRIYSKCFPSNAVFKIISFNQTCIWVKHFFYQKLHTCNTLNNIWLGKAFHSIPFNSWQ